MEFQREFIEIGQFQIRYYGIIIVAAILVATFVAVRLVRLTKRDPEHVYGALTWAIIPGIIGARLWFVTFPPVAMVEAGFDRAWFFSPDNFFNLENGAIAFASGGLSIFGALIGGLLGAYIYLVRNKLIVPAWLDLAAVVLPLGQAIGRWGNFINRELYGIPTELPWGLDIPLELRPEQYRAIEYFDARFHPLFLYESLWSLAAFFVLLWLYRTQRNRFRPGDFFLLYLMQYAVIRFFLETIRIEVTLVGDTNLAQVAAAAMFVLGVAGLLYRHRPGVQAVAYDLAAPAEPWLEEVKKAKKAEKDARKKAAPAAQPMTASASAGGSAAVVEAPAVSVEPDKAAPDKPTEG